MTKLSIEPDGGIKYRGGYVSSLDYTGRRTLTANVIDPSYAEEHTQLATEFDAAITPRLLARNFIKRLWPGGAYEDAFDDREVEEAVDQLLELAPLLRVEWQPMSTAPKDGSEIIGCSKGRGWTRFLMAVVHYMPGGHCVEDHPPIAEGWYYWNGCLMDRLSDPIVWHPLPAVPTDNALATLAKAAVAGGK